MSKIKIAELFYSIQGEGRFMGVPSIFLRTFGCNFKCAGFGMPAGEKSTEAESIDPNKYRIYNELPLVSTGCDSYASWDPRFKDLSPMMEVSGIAKRMMELLPFNKWKQEHLVITGGEPLLGWQKAYPDLLQQPEMAGLKELTFETNGTQELHPSFSYFLKDWIDAGRGYNALTFSVSPKLSCSGEDQAVAIRPDIIRQYQEIGYTYLKFVIATEDDCQEALKTIDMYTSAGFKGPVYLMPVGGVESVYTLNNKNVALMAMRYGLRYSDRLQVPLFHNAWAT
jgi:organic radical activating enzyme